ncbi:synaptonemal complex protein 2-like [Megalops cyprinoides]|uniref:synaptonemal complex protein 2-like n=1 Tax=Megalops cyprinoides TaxID=118141 RepID=UPI001864A297|nr:synaptonemal complex protein 2-like [Megalops cyprinoides]
MLQQREDDVFHLNNHSDTEVVRAKARLFSQSTSSNGSAKSTPDIGGKRREFHKTSHSRHASESDSRAAPGDKRRRPSIRFDYTRKKPRPKSKLKILPLSSASSAEEPAVVKHSTPVPESVFQQQKCLPAPKDQGLDISPVPVKTWQVPDSESSVSSGNPVFDQAGQAAAGVEECITGKVTVSPSAVKRNKDIPAAVLGLVPEKQQMLQEEDQLGCCQTPTVLYPSSPRDCTKERITTMLTEGSESEMDSGVISAFQTFKNQLREHFASRYRKIESQSLESLSDCKKNVASLLRTVHNHRLMHLESFHSTVVTELANLEQDCHSLKEVERETVNFWRTESQTVELFCDRQQKRLQSLELLRKSTGKEAEEDDVASSSQETPLEKDGNNALSAKTPTTT